MKITEKQICEDQIVTFKQSHILYQGLLFFNTINMCDRGRTITHMQIPRFHTQVWYNSHKTISKKISFYIFLSLDFVRKCLIDNMAALVPLMTSKQIFVDRV